MGVQTIEFLVSKGLRQEDPLALFLFNIVAEGNKRNNWVNILQYADDTIFMGEATLSNMVTIKCMLRCFQIVSGLKVNFFKSRFGTIGVSDNCYACIFCILKSQSNYLIFLSFIAYFVLKQ